MTEQEKQLLLKDLCARLPYGVKVNYANKIYDLPGCYGNNLIIVLPFLSNLEAHPIETCKLYLRPMSSMTENEKQEIRNFFRKCIDDLHGKSSEEQFFLGFCQDAESLDYLNMHYLDYRGLIAKGLALEAPEGMYNI